MNVFAGGDRKFSCVRDMLGRKLGEDTYIHKTGRWKASTGKIARDNKHRISSTPNATTQKKSMRKKARG